MTTVTFEGLVASNGTSETIPLGYDGFNRGGFGVLGKKYIDNTFPSGDDGYHNAISGKGVAFAQDAGDGHVDSTISLPGKGMTFTIKSGTFAAAWNTGETVTFHAFGSHGEFTKVVVMDQTAHEIHFGKHFKHIGALEITSEGGTDADGDDGGSGVYIAMDNLKLVADTAAVPPHEHHHQSAYHYGVEHPAEWGFV